MTITAVGPLLDAEGVSAARELKQGRDGPDLTMRAWRIDLDTVRRVQPARIPVDFNHDERWLGQCVYLERSARHLWAVCELDAEPPAWMGPWHWSGKFDSRESDGGDGVLQALALTGSPRQLGLRQHPLLFLEGGVDYRGLTKRHAWANRVDAFQRGLLERAASAKVHRLRGQPIVIRDSTQPDLDRLDDGERHALFEHQQHQRQLRWRPATITRVG